MVMGYQGEDTTPLLIRSGVLVSTDLFVCFENHHTASSSITVETHAGGIQ